MANKNFRVKNGLEIGNSISITDAGVVSGLTTNNLAEGATNKYYTDARADARVAVGIAALVDSAPTTLDTLNELAAALGDDPNFATTTASALGNKLNTADFNSTADAWIATKDTDDLDEGTTNQYFTTARARAAISVTDSGGDGSLSYNDTTGVVTYTGPSPTEVRAHFSGGTGVTITDGSVAIGQAVDTGATPSFAGLSAGNLTVGVATDNTIASTNTNGDIIIDPNGTGLILANAVTRVQGEVLSTTEPTYVFPAQTLNTVTDNNGYSAASSFPTGTNGYGANATFTHYYGDTLAGVNTSSAFNFRNANGNSTTGMTVPFTGLTSVATSASPNSSVMGTLNFNGYATTNFTSEVATANQGGGINALHSMQVQSYTTEAPSDSTLTLTSTNVTAVASSFRAGISSPSVTGTRGQISFTSTTPSVGQAVRVTGTLTGTATGIVSGQDYYIIVTNGSTTATLSATPGGSPITTTAGTLTGLTLTRCSVTFTMTGLTNVPFGRGAKVAVSGITNVTNGTYPVWGTPTATSMSIGIPHSVAPTVAGSQTFSCLTTYQGAGFRIRTYPTTTPANLQNRLEMLDMTPAAATIRSNTITLNTGAYGNTGVGITGNNIIYNRVYGQFQYMSTVTPAAANTAYVFPLGTADFNNIVTVGSTSRLIPGAAGFYNLEFSVQCNNADNSNDHTAYVWLRKNGADVAGSMGRMTMTKATGGGLKVIGWNYLINPANATDYYELAYAVDDTQVTFPAFASTAFGPSTAALITSLTPVGA